MLLKSGDFALFDFCKSFHLRILTATHRADKNSYEFSFVCMFLLLTPFDHSLRILSFGTDRGPDVPMSHTALSDSFKLAHTNLGITSKYAHDASSSAS